MSTKFIKETPGASGVDYPVRFADNAGVCVDTSDGYKVKYNANGTVAVLADSLNGQKTTAAVTNGYAAGAGGAVTQTGSASGTVVLAKPCGQITTFNLTGAAAAEDEFICTNSLVKATDVVTVNVGSYTGTGTPVAYVKSVGSGTFSVGITNLSASALGGAAVLNYAVTAAVNA